jgi:hypothetical protein
MMRVDYPEPITSPKKKKNNSTKGKKKRKKWDYAVRKRQPEDLLDEMYHMDAAHIEEDHAPQTTQVRRTEPRGASRATTTTQDVHATES